MSTFQSREFWSKCTKHEPLRVFDLFPPFSPFRNLFKGETQKKSLQVFLARIQSHQDSWSGFVRKSRDGGKKSRKEGQGLFVCTRTRIQKRREKNGRKRENN